ncbi:hypothetical protein AB0L88_19160 [Saccharopolyspora shandongensis]|uniref:hypothetical protein n=1 Tax=Saccharopolyspora shandongensis TaxID=418495 RepID=UPI0034355977
MTRAPDVVPGVRARTKGRPGGDFEDALSIRFIAIAPWSWPAIGVSAIVYGLGFMATSGLLAVWSYRVFPDQPSVGFSATVFFLGIGVIVGPALFGALADAWNLRAALMAQGRHRRGGPEPTTSYHHRP